MKAALVYILIIAILALLIFAMPYVSAIIATWWEGVAATVIATLIVLHIV